MTRPARLPRAPALAALALTVAAIAACAVYFAGLGNGAPAAGQGEPPGLTISLPPNCEGGQADPGYGGIWGYDDDGDWVRTGSSGPFYFLNDLGFMTLRWQIEGGTAPYELSVQGQTLLTGPTGSTIVYCADSLPVDELDFTAGRSELERQRTDSPALVNPGPLRLEATVVDANGLAARAAATTYVILDCRKRHCDFEVYPSGFTYRIWGMLFTVPQGLRLDARWLGQILAQCVDDPGPTCQDELVLRVAGDPHGAQLHIGIRTREYLGYSSALSPEFQWAIPDYATAAGTVGGTADAPAHPDADKFSEFGKSFGQRPSLPENEEGGR